MRRIAPWMVAFGLASSGLHAQDSQLRSLVRNPDARGLPSLEVNLDAKSTQRYALVIGNSDYDQADDLPNAKADAALVSELFREAGYIVVEHYDLTKRGFEAALRQTLYEMDFGAELAFYYAGHGVQIGDGNFLIPTDLATGSVHDVRMGTVSLASIMSLFSSRARSVMAVLDSCRNNPFPDLEAVVSLSNTPRPLQTGFAAPTSPINSLVVFSTSPGSLALDGTGENSPFTRAFVDTVRSNPDRPVDELMKDIRRDVYQQTQKLQVPWSSSSLVEPIIMGSTVAAQGELPIAFPETEDARQVSSRLDRKVPVGRELTQGPLKSKQFALIEPPAVGRLELKDESGFQSVPVGQLIETERLGDIVYSTQFNGIQTGVAPSAQLRDSFELQVGNAAQTYDISLEVDPCDRHAGDHLDPDSVGIARYPNEIEPRTALAACKAAVSRAPDVGRFHYQLGRVQLALKDLAGARASFERAAALEHVRGYHGLGTIELAAQNASRGQGRTAAPQAALSYFLEGVKRGDPYAYHSLGLQLLQFPKGAADQRHGFELLSRSLELGHTFSMNALGLYFLDENAAHYDPARGLRYLEESASRGDIYGYANLGYIALTGTGGTQKDLAKAESYFRKAAAGGHPAAASSLGRMYVNGQIGGVQDDQRAIEWYDIGMERGDAWGGANAAWVIANRNPRGYTAFDAVARAAKAANMRSEDAAQAAMDVLREMNKRALDGGAQQLMRELGADITVDGAFGADSRRALNKLGAAYNYQFPDTPEERVLTLAKLFWENTKFRVDLY